MPDPQALVVDLPDEAAMERLGEDLAAILAPGDCLALSGDLGAGKSTLARALIRATAGDPLLEVPSPTFTLVQTYDLRFPVAHFDLYRIGDPDELDELGLDASLADGAALVEWPENAGALLPPDAIALRIDENGAGRRVAIKAPSDSHQRIARTLAIRGFLDDAGYRRATRRYLLGDASPRAYETIVPHTSVDEAGDPLILMNAPAVPPGPPVRDGKPYTRLAHIAEDVRPFVALDGLLRAHGLSAPRILASDIHSGFVLLEHFGHHGVVDDDGAPIEVRYEAAMDVLAAFHETPVSPDVACPDGTVHTIPPFDRTAMAIEVDQFIDWYAPRFHDGVLTDEHRGQFRALWRDLIERVQHSERHLVLRDVHSPNLFWLGDRSGPARVGLIDFQDAMIGPAAYDVASLVQDARATVAPDLADRLLRRYHDGRTGNARFDPKGFDEAFAIMAAQRATKILGIFVRLDVRDGKPGYLRHLPRLRRYLAAALDHQALHPLRDWHRQVGLGLESAREGSDS